VPQIALQLIQHDDALKSSLDNLRSQEPTFLAIDTEFTRRTTYWPQLELIQIGIPGSPILVIDCKAITDWSPLLSLLSDTAIMKVFHSARQDLEGFLRLFKTLPTPIFDLQIAAAFMGFGHSIGLGDLVEQLLGESPNKSEQHSNWEMRPLRPAQVSYAAMDAHYLIELYPIVLEQLESLGRSTWLTEFCELLEQPSRLITKPEHAWVKLRSHLKNEAELFFCKEFSTLREQLAQEANYNKTRVINDADLIQLCQHMAFYVRDQKNNTQNVECEEQIALLSPPLMPLLDKVTPEFYAAFSEAQHASIDAFHSTTDFRQLRSHLRHGLGTLFTSTQQKQLFDAKVRLNAEANRLVIPMHYLAPSTMLDDYILMPRDIHPLITGWRQSIIQPIMTDIMMLDVQPRNSHEE
jgi:ribonuclease D